MFRDGCPPTHVLLRDYARGVIEVALRRGAQLTIEVSKIRPPYGSAWPQSVPPEKKLEKLGQWTDKMVGKEWARVHLYSSIMREEDFARYVIDPNIGKFTSQRLTAPEVIPPKKREETFERSLLGPQKKAYAHYKKLVEQRTLTVVIRAMEEELAGTSESASKEPPGKKGGTLRPKIEKAKEEVRRLLRGNKRNEFDCIIVPYLTKGRFNSTLDVFDRKLAKRFILGRVLKMGWTVDRFGEFDGNVGGGGREAKKSERIGKKYQWIAFFEILAMIAAICL